MRSITGLHVATAIGALTLLASGSVPATAAGAIGYLPPDLDYKAVCATSTPAAPALDRDWTQWHGEAVTTAPEDMLSIAGEYLTGSSRIAKSAPTATAMLDYLRTTHAIAPARIDRLLGKALVTTPETPADVVEGEKLLLRALDGGLPRAAGDLAVLYGPKGPAELRNPTKSRGYYRIAAAAGVTDSQLAYARLLYADANANPAEKKLAIDNAILGMIERTASGECRYMPVIAGLYLSGQMVEQNFSVGIAWLEQFAETGDARTEERLGGLLASRVVGDADGKRAMDYLESAALQGRSSAALSVGIAYASGVSRDKDLASAEKFLKIASDAGVADSDRWLARLYRGEFGGTPQPQLAKTHFERALAKDEDADLETDFGQFLAETPEVADLPRARQLLEKAAAAGSGKAAVMAAKLAYANANGDAAGFAEADAYFRLGLQRGRPEAARQLARISLCGVVSSLSPDKARDWEDRAIYLGSPGALFDAAIARIGSANLTVAAEGMALLKQATLIGEPEALAYSIAHYERGVDAFPLDEDYANQLVRFIEVNPDPAFRLDASLELIKARLKLAQSGDEIAAQYARLDALVATGAPQASQLKADLLRASHGADLQTITALYAVAATSGDRRAMRDYALILRQDPASAASSKEWLQKAAAAGDPKSRIMLIDPLDKTALADLKAVGASGFVCSVDERVALARAIALVPDTTAVAEAKVWLQSAEELAGNDPDALYKIGDAYRDGVGGADLVANAEDYFNRSAAAGKNAALKDVADGHLLGLWRDSSPEQARASLASLVESGDPNAGSMMLRAIASHQISASLTEVEQLLATTPDGSKTGDTFMKLIRLDEAGTFGAPHADKQFEWLQHAADAGNTGAMMRLYRAYASGIGVSQSAEAAVQWLSKAAEGGDPRAASELAAAYDVGFGVPADPVKAALWRDRAGPQG